MNDYHKNKKLLSLFLKNEKGIAIIMIMTTISLLTFLLADLTFETKLNKLRVYNYQDKAQARLNAEAGLRLALAKLKLYMKGKNLLEKNDTLKGSITPSSLEQAVTSPFIFPIPLTKNANIIQRSAIEEFSENTLLRGKLSVEMTAVSGFLNPNNLRIPSLKEDNENNSNSGDEEKSSPALYIEKALVKTLDDAMRAKKEEDDDFDALYGNMDPELLIKELKYYVNSPAFFEDSERSEIEALYLEHETSPKHAPLSSLDELYLLAGWNDAIIDLIKDRLTVHEASVIQVNKITKNQLKVIFPEITEEQLEEFFKYRDGDQDLKEEGKEFKNAADFKEVITNQLGVLDSSSYDKKVKEFEEAGLKIGVAGKLFKVISTGEMNRSIYRLTAFIDLPIKPPIPKEKKKDDGKEPTAPDRNDQSSGQGRSDKTDKTEEDDKKEPQELMLPRVIEVRID